MVESADKPRLTPEDGRRLQILFEEAHSPFALAAQTGAPVHEILDWFDQPHIQRHVENIERLETAELRRTAVAMLTELAAQADDPLEKRRIGCAILRALARPRISSLRSQTGAHQPVPARPSARPGARQAPPDPIDESQPPIEEPPRPPAPPERDFSILAQPSPDYGPIQAITKQLLALQRTDTPFSSAGAATVQNFAADDFSNQHLPRDLFCPEFNSRFGADLRNFDAFDISDPKYNAAGDEATLEVLLEDERGGNIYHTSLTWYLSRPRDGPKANCWLTSEIVKNS